EATAGMDRVEYDLCPAVQVADLMGKLQTFRPHILHFSGHGALGGTYFVRGQDQEVFVPVDAFRQVIASAATNDLFLVVLSSCESEAQAQSLSSLVPCAIGTREPVSNEISVYFSQAFYRALGRGSSIQQA